jgi:hypothetical protein
MKKSLAAALLFAGVVAAGAALAVAHPTRPTHNSANHGSGHPAQTKSAQIKGTIPIERQSVPRRSPFETCQHQDPSTPAVRLGTSECFALPY